MSSDNGNSEIFQDLSEQLKRQHLPYLSTRFKLGYVPEQRFVFWSVPQPPLPLLLIERFLEDPIRNYIEKVHIIPRILSCSSYFSSKLNVVLSRSKRLWNVTAPDHFLGLAWAPHVTRCAVVLQNFKSSPGRRGVQGGAGGTPDFKWRGWSNGGKNQNPEKFLGISPKPPKNPMPNFRALKISRKHEK